MNNCRTARPNTYTIRSILVRHHGLSVREARELVGRVDVTALRGRFWTDRKIADRLAVAASTDALRDSGRGLFGFSSAFPSWAMAK